MLHPKNFVLISPFIFSSILAASLLCLVRFVLLKVQMSLACLTDLQTFAQQQLSKTV